MWVDFWDLGRGISVLGEMPKSDNETSSIEKTTCNKIFCDMFTVNKPSGFITSKYPGSGRGNF